MQQLKVGAAYVFALLAILVGFVCLGIVFFDARYPDGSRRGIGAVLYDWPFLLLGGAAIAGGIAWLIAQAKTTAGKGDEGLARARATGAAFGDEAGESPDRP